MSRAEIEALPVTWRTAALVLREKRELNWQSRAETFESCADDLQLVLSHGHEDDPDGGRAYTTELYGGAT